MLTIQTVNEGERKRAIQLQNRFPRFKFNESTGQVEFEPHGDPPRDRADVENFIKRGTGSYAHKLNN